MAKPSRDSPPCPLPTWGWDQSQGLPMWSLTTLNTQKFGERVHPQGSLGGWGVEEVVSHWTGDHPPL